MCYPLKSWYLILLLLLLAATTTAQEFWLLPTRFFVAVGSRQKLHLFVGEDFVGKRWTGNSSRLARLVHYSATDSTDLTATATRTDTLQTTVVFQQAGLHLLTCTTTNAFTELAGDNFTAYLQENGLDHALTLRRQRGETTKPAREAYRRCAKTLVVAGAVTNPTSDSVFASFTRQPLEFIPEQNPYALKVGSALTMRLLYEGKPLPRALVQVWQRGDLGQKITRRTKLYTNQNGRVLFHLSAPGSYMISAVHMVPVTNRQTADWQSTWATFTFEFAPQRLIPARD